MTTWEALALVVGDAWANKVWPIARDRSGLLHEIVDIAPRWAIRMRGDGRNEMVDTNAAARAAWLTRAAEQCDAMRL